MTTQKPLTGSPRTARTTRLRSLAAAAVLAPLLALGACSSEAPITADPTRSTGVDAVTSTPTSSAATSTTTTPTTTPVAPPTKKAVKVTIKDPTLGHVIQVTEVVRNLPWPAGNPVGQEAFEIVGVKVKLTAGARYSAPLSPSQLSLRLGKTSVPPTSEFGARFGTLAKTVKREQSGTGWVIFKIEKDVHPLVMLYNRPAYQVSTTDKAIPAKVFPAQLTD